MKNMLIHLCTILILFITQSEARVLCPRVVSEHTADMSDWKRFREFHQWKDKEGQELAIAVWQYLSGYETGVYHFNEILEGDDPFAEYASVRDPQKILNVYNMGYCGIFGPVMDGVFQNIGFENGRAFGIDLWNHCATELWYGDKWHYFDLDVRGVLLDENGEIASLKQAQTIRELWTNPQVAIEPFFPKDEDKNKVFEIYRDSQVNYYYRWYEGSHTMDFSLRQGETFTRWWNPQGGRWQHHNLYNETEWTKELLLEVPLGMKPNHRNFTKWNHGNGLLQYSPNLTNQSSDFFDGVYTVYNLKPGKDGLEFMGNGSAEVVYEVFTPYIIVAKVNELDDWDDDSEASMITIQSDSLVQLLVSLNHGHTWKFVDVVNAQNMRKIDLSKWIKGKYGYLLKLTMNGKAGDTAIRNLNMETWVQVAPVSLPLLKKGSNQMRYELGDRYGLETEPVIVNPSTADPEDVKHYFTNIPDDYDPDRHTSRMVGEAVLHLQAPLGKKISWFSVGGTFRTHQGEYATQTKNQIAYAIDEPLHFQEIYSASVPTWVNHWRYNWDGDVCLEQPVKDVFIQYIGDPGLNTVRACLHTVSDSTSSHEIEITHGFEIEGVLQTKTVMLEQPSDYLVVCDEEPENVFIRFAVPSRTNIN